MSIDGKIILYRFTWTYVSYGHLQFFGLKTSLNDGKDVTIRRLDDVTCGIFSMIMILVVNELLVDNHFVIL